MDKSRFIVRETFGEKITPEEAFAVAFLSEAALTQEQNSLITEVSNPPQDSLCSEKGADEHGTSDE